MKSTFSFLLAEYYFYPEGWAGAEFPRAIAAMLSRGGNRVEVLCGAETYQPATESIIDDPVAEGVRLLKVARLPFGLGRHARLLGQLWFCFAGAVRLLTRPSPTVYITQTNPPPFLPIIALIAAVRRRPLVVIAQDLYPEVLLAHGSAGARMAAWLVRLPFNAAYRSAVRVVSQGPAMTERLRRKGVASGDIVEIPNWSAGEPSGGAGTAASDARQRVIAYTGNLGAGHEYETLLVAFARSPLPAAGYRLHFIGKVVSRANLVARSRELGVADHVTLAGPLALPEFNEYLSTVALAVCTMRPGFGGVVVPSKVMGYMARGAPILYIGPPGDIWRLVESTGAGGTFLNGDVDAVVAFLNLLSSDAAAYAERGLSGKDYYWRYLSRTRALKSYDILFRLIADQVAPG